MSSTTNNFRRFVISTGGYHTGLTDKNNLMRYLMETRPQQIMPVMNTLFSQTQLKSTPLLDMAISGGEMLLDNSSDYWTWDMKLSEYNPATVVENLEASTTAPGLDGQPFRIKFDKRIFTHGDIISTDKRNIQFYVGTEEIYQVSDGYVYTCYLITDDVGAQFVAQKYLQVGIEYLKYGTIYGEASSQASELFFTPKVKLMNNIGDMHRLKHDVTGYAEQRDITVANVDVMGADGKVVPGTSRWFNYAEAEGWKQSLQLTDSYLMWSRKSSNLRGDSGYGLKTIAGLWQMTDYGWKSKFSKFSIPFLEEILLDVFFGRKEGADRNVVLWTGEAGMRMFSRAVRNELNTFGTFLISKDNYLRGEAMAMGGGGQFISWEMIGGGKITLQHMPSLDYDSTNYEKNTGVEGRYPASSASFIIHDLSGMRKNNIKVVRFKNWKDTDFGYIGGAINPFNMKRGFNATSLKHAYSMFWQNRVGLHIEDPTAMLKLEFDATI